MEAIEFDTTMQNNGKIELPIQFRHSIEKNTKLRVIVLINKNNTVDDWQKHAATNFFDLENEADDIYNKL